MDKNRIKAIAEMLLSEIDCPQQDREEENRLTRNLTAQERAVLGKPHPGDFGIPKEHWEAAKAYAMFYSENYLVAAGIKTPNAK